MDGLPHVPGDIVNSIFLQLTVKSLSRFKSCCKSWHCCVDDADFINGLVFVTSYGPGYSMTLFNPAVGKYKLIPNSLLTQKTNRIFGFAYDFVTEDYKVICVPYLINDDYVDVVEVYSVKNQCWRTIHNTNFPISLDSCPYLYNNQVSLNGVIHRMSYNRTIIPFHLVDEKFTVTIVPSTCGKQTTLLALGYGICVFTTVGEEILIWSLEKDRWNCIHKFPTLLSLIGMPPICKRFPGTFLFVKENGNILWRKHDGSFIDYDVQKNEYTEFKSIQVPSFGPRKTSYVESLVSLKIPWD
ncbi:hypothetical protein H5410_005822 [Solanum commersonii]|uniref:F-box associated beta-propeller type 3 domain-containing protein n=1 Tax=Solanum commersonii TaxID=4109 RepID=A0A9J6A8K5_SOLCO|nr:hypothetical protein H5410_005822 [Solanum commersonii]